MLLYDKVQELLSAHERLKAQNADILELASSTLKSYVDNALESRTAQLEAQLKSVIANALAPSTLEPQLQATLQALLEPLYASAREDMPALLSAKVQELLKDFEPAQHAQELLSKRLEGWMTHERQLSLLESVRTHLNPQFEAFLNALQTQAQAQSQTLHTQAQERLEALMRAFAHKAEEALQTSLSPAIQEHLSHYDFSALHTQDFLIPALERHIKALFLAHLEGSYLKEYFLKHFEDFLQEAQGLRALKSMELEAQLHLSSLLVGNAVAMLQAQEQAYYQQQIATYKFKNTLALERARAALLEQWRANPHDMQAYHQLLHCEQERFKAYQIWGAGL
ncbi:hypothetical protein ACFOPX_03445 [Helicobacter baculiformis]|uniref:Uncharacterized protein n=1 Tax=Helicobacter baculiformis TaxID=427351 RepID=A0ABV7ZJM5_9HELI|nr:hypothetical protein [Helicobacter baculiformis]